MTFKRIFFNCAMIFFSLQVPLQADGMSDGEARSAFDFGAERLLSNANGLLEKYAQSGPCLLIERSVADCEFIDGNGIRYAVFEGQIVRIEADARSVKKEGMLPFGLEFGDGRSVVIKKLQRFHQDSAVAELANVLASGEEAASTHVRGGIDGMDEYQFYLRFDARGRLRVVGRMATVL